MPDTPPMPRRRNFRFGLRSMFVVVTVLGCGLGYQSIWISQRRELIASKDVYVWGEVRAPGLLWLLGEPGYRQLAVLVPNPSILSPEDEANIARARKLFPEVSAVYRMHAPARG